MAEPKKKKKKILFRDEKAVRRAPMGPASSILLRERRISPHDAFQAPLNAGEKSGVCSILKPNKKTGEVTKQCPVQLTFVGGKPHLRLCLKENIAGRGGLPRVVPLPDDGAAANRVAKRICDAWHANGGSFVGTESTGLGRFFRRYLH